VIKFTSILSRWEAAELTQMDAAELLGINERIFRRWRQRFEDDGGKDGPDHGTGDRDLGKVEGDGAGVAHGAVQTARSPMTSATRSSRGGRDRSAALV
jgi:transposase-like protein